MFQCHYEVLSVDKDADAATIKKAHRKLAIKLHPDKNLNDENSAEKFRLVQEAYECLSDVTERKWYDEHRDALLKGWSPNGGGGGENGDMSSMLFDVIPFMHAHCYTGYEDGDEKSFYGIYGHVFASLAKEEADAVDDTTTTDEKKEKSHTLPFDFGDSKTDPKDIANFYLIWEGFVSRQTFSWADQYDLKEAENRRVRRAMEDENKKARKALRKARNEDVLALVRFCKRRDPRMKALKARQEQEKAAREKLQAENIKIKKKEKQKARDKWREQTEEHMAQTEEMDRLAGRVRLADLEDEYDYGGGKKKGKKGKKKGKKGKKQLEEEKEDNDEQNQQEDKEDNEASDTKKDGDGDEALDNGTNGDTSDAINQPEQDDLSDGNGEVEKVELSAEPSQEEEESEPSSEEEEEEEEPDAWRCECCRKDFKSQGQMENHMKSKKHKEVYKKYQKKLEKELMEEMINDM